MKLRLLCSLWNARSTVNKTSALTSSILEHQTDIFLLTETWLRNTNNPTLGDLRSSLSGYDVIHQARNGRKGGGVAIVCRKNLHCQVQSTEVFNSFECVISRILSKSERLIFVVIYRPPRSAKNQSLTADFLMDFSRLLEPLISDPAHLIISGDFNFHFENHDDPNRNKFCELLSNLYLCQLVCKPTHRSGHILDLVITHANQNSISDVSLGCQMG